MQTYKVLGVGPASAHHEHAHRLYGAIVEPEDDTEESLKHKGGGYYWFCGRMLKCPKCPYLAGRPLCCRSLKLRKLNHN